LLNLSKGANTSLTASRPALQRILVAIGWGVPATMTADLDLSVLLCGSDGRVPHDSYVVFADQLTDTPAPAAPAPAATAVDDEQVEVDLAAVPGYVHRIVFAGAIYQAESRRQTFGQLVQPYIRVADLDTGEDLVRYTLEHDCAGETALAFGELYRHSSGWKFRAIGQGWSNGLAGLTRDYGAGGR
jgi:tellurium resistance protein TerD